MTTLQDIDKKFEDDQGSTVNCGDIYFLWTEVHRLMAAIEKHKKSREEYMEGFGHQSAADFDDELYKVLAED